MLKRNGEMCEHAVPDYAGRLTDTEFLAYNTAFSVVENDFKNFSAMSKSLLNVESSLGPLAHGNASLNGHSEQIETPNGLQWTLVAPLMSFSRGDIVLCKRDVVGGHEFAVVERLPADSALASAQGRFEVQHVGADPHALLRDFVNENRSTLQMYADDIVAQARETIEEKYPGCDMSRVLDAVSDRCTRQFTTKQAEKATQAQKENMGVRV